MNKKQLNIMLKLIDDIYHELENTDLKSIFKLQKNNRDKVLNTVSELILDYKISDSKLDISHKDKLVLKKKLSKLIADIAESEYLKEKGLMEELLRTSATERYMVNYYMYSEVLKINYNLKPLPDKDIKNIINAKVDKKLWSDRLWKQKRCLEKTLRKELYNLIDGKTDINQISREVSKTYAQSYSNSRRLARTEGARVQESVNEEWGKRHSVKKQMFVATLDKKTSKTCAGLDSTVWSFDDKAKPIPPLHPNCRSTLVPLPDTEEYKPSGRMDNISKENVSFSTYKEWLKS